MKLDGIDIDTTLKELELTLAQEKELSPALRSMIGVLILIVKLLTNRIGLNSSNSSKPPSGDLNRKKKTRKASNKKAGGQKNHPGTTLKQIDDPDEIATIQIDRRSLPKGHDYQDAGFESRQVFDIEITRMVTEYQAQVLVDENGKRFKAPFPEGVTKAVQYGGGLKAHAVYMSQYQLLPYNRIQEYFGEQLNISLSQGTIFNFNKDAFKRLAVFNEITKEALITSNRVHADETGININGKGHWLHCASNDLWTDFYPHKKRGCEAMDSRGILPQFKGVLCHDHWKPYYRYQDCLHALCNAHHLRELTRAHEQDNQVWAEKMKGLLEEINKTVINANNSLNEVETKKYLRRYRKLLRQAEIECPPPEEVREKGQRGRLKRSKARNLLERLINYESDVLRFMDDPDVPFTNNLGERDIRMTKVQQKISGCFRSMEGAEIFCRVRGYLSTCRKHGVSSSHAMNLIFEGKLPNFVDGLS
ncbi:MAG: IS66 family transposase [Enterobacterales bacterium]|nr:IS66 family transposase [Enterobacterales bacterium]